MKIRCSKSGKGDPEKWAIHEFFESEDGLLWNVHNLSQGIIFLDENGEKDALGWLFQGVEKRKFRSISKPGGDGIEEAYFKLV